MGEWVGDKQRETPCRIIKDGKKRGYPNTRKMLSKKKKNKPRKKVRGEERNIQKQGWLKSLEMRRGLWKDSLRHKGCNETEGMRRSLTVGGLHHARSLKKKDEIQEGFNHTQGTEEESDSMHP